MSGAPRQIVRAALLACALAALPACGRQAADAAPPEAPLLVETAAIGAVAEAGSVRATGTVRARRETVLAFTTAGRVASIATDEGEIVRAGQSLARLAPDRVNASNTAARAEADRARADLARQRTLFASGWTTRVRLEAAEAAARSAQAQVSATGFDVGAASISAPTSGVVLRRHVERNQIVAAGEPIVTMAEASGGFVVRVPLADGDLARIGIGRPARVTLSALGGSVLDGQVIEIGGRGDERTGTFEAEIALPAAPGLRSGLIGDVEIVAAPPAGAGTRTISVPPLALFAVRAGEGFVYVIDKGRARARLVQLGGVDDGAVRLLGGLAPGERVVTSGVERLRDGMPVRETRR